MKRILPLLVLCSLGAACTRNWQDEMKHLAESYVRAIAAGTETDLELPNAPAPLTKHSHTNIPVAKGSKVESVKFVRMAGCGQGQNSELTPYVTNYKFTEFTYTGCVHVDVIVEVTADGKTSEGRVSVRNEGARWWVLPKK